MNEQYAGAQVTAAKVGLKLGFPAAELDGLANRSRYQWLYIQNELLRSPAVAYYEARFLWSANLATILVSFTLATLVTTLIRSLRGADIDILAAGFWSMLSIAFFFPVRRRLYSHVKDYMRVARVAMEHRWGPFQTDAERHLDGEGVEAAGGASAPSAGDSSEATG